MAVVNRQIDRKIPRRIAQAIISSLKGGVVPRIGLPYITVGRKSEIEALLRDVDIIEEGGASFRFIVGRYGSGKSFLLQTVRNYVMERGFIVLDADLSPERRLQGKGGQGLATYRELVRNLSTKTKPEGGALGLVLDRWINGVQALVASETQTGPDDDTFEPEVEKKIKVVIHSLGELVHGFDFARLILLYYRSYIDGDDTSRDKVIKWFRGEYGTKTEARNELGVNVIISDDDWYDYLKLFALFFRLAGYKGMMIFIDELVNIYKIPNTVSRNYNYEKILTMYNDTLQGRARYLGILMSGTVQCIEDRRRGVYSYEALRSRLAEGKFSREGARDMFSPVIRLESLTSEEMTILCEKLSQIHASLYGYSRKIDIQDIMVFIQIEYGRIGSDTNITPREVIRDFIELMDILCQNPEKKVSDLLGSSEFSYAKSKDVNNEVADPKFAEFTL